jgi:hypothetical protein
MVGLQVISVLEVPEEVASWQSEASLKVRDEDDAFTGLRCRHDLSSR